MENPPAALDPLSVAKVCQESVIELRSKLTPEPTATSFAPDSELTVCLRKRPVSDEEKANTGVTTFISENVADKHEFECLTVQPAPAGVQATKIYMHEQITNKTWSANRGNAVGSVTAKEYTFHNVFGDHEELTSANTEAKEDAVYASAVKGMVSECLAAPGTHATCIAYGQTGSGKTYTCRALQARVVRDLFAAGSKTQVKIAFFENQGDRTFDLQQDRRELTLREDLNGRCTIVGLEVSDPVTSVDACMALIEKANDLRATEPTANNPHSSRSHAVCEFHIATSDADDAATSVLRLVDLAGNERRSDVEEHNADRIGEMKDINWSLGCLKECIRMQREGAVKLARAAAKQGASSSSSAADSSKSTVPATTEDAPMDGSAPGASAPHAHIPYRRCKLTFILKDCFTVSVPSPSNVNPDAAPQARAKTVFIGHVGPMHSGLGHSRNTLGYMTELMDACETGAMSSAGAAAGVKAAGVGAAAGAVKKPPPPPEKWSKVRFNKWLATVDDGRFTAEKHPAGAEFLECFAGLDGSRFHFMPPGKQGGGLVLLCEAAGGTEEEAILLREAWRVEIVNYKKKMAARKKAEEAAKAAPAGAPEAAMAA